MIYDAGFYQDLLNNLDEGVIFLDRDRVIRYWSRGAEALTGFTAQEASEGGCTRHCMRFAGLEEMKSCNGSCSIHKALVDGEMIEEEIYFQHKEGHRIPVSLRLIPFRDEPNGPVSGVVEVLRDNSRKTRITHELEELRKLSLIDPLTEIGNRRFGDLTLNNHLDTLKRYGTPFGLLLLDVDRFKTVNDTYGHNAGDRVLRMIGRTLQLNLRSFDATCRWGGEEFLALILNVNAAQLLEIAEKLRLLVETSPIRYGTEPLKVTVSLGATLARSDDTLLELIGRADTAMYKAKESGRNRVVFA